jgi:hypothetical protein
VIVVADRKTVAESSALFFQHQEEREMEWQVQRMFYKGREEARGLCDTRQPGTHGCCMRVIFVRPWKSVEGNKVGSLRKNSIK